MTGIGKWRWTHADRRYTLAASTVPVETPPDRSRAIWKALPIDAGRPSNLLTEKTILLPDGGRGFSLDGSPAMDVMLPGNRHVRTRATLSGGKLDVTTRIEAAGGEIDPAALPDLRAKIADIRNHALKLRTEPDYPSPWHGIEAAKRARLYDPALQIFAQSIAAKPDDAGRYLARAEFLATLFERREAIADLDRALALQADVKTYRLRASLFRDLGEKPKAIADLKAANELDPGDTGTLTSLARTLSESGAAPAALSLLDQAIDSGGDNAPVLMAEKADVQADAGHVQDALATMESAVDIKPGNARLLNARCWLKAAHNVDLEAAVKDCSRAIELSEQVAPIALDSRAMAYFRQGKLTEALADLDAAIDARPAQAASLYLRAQVERKLGQTDKAGQDVADARLISPRVDEEYGRYGLAW
jgi:tetratricopeptide (TPR) repeat protein